MGTWVNEDCPYDIAHITNQLCSFWSIKTGHFHHCPYDIANITNAVHIGLYKHGHFHHCRYDIVHITNRVYIGL